MYTPFKDESSPINIKLPWDTNTARGFGAAIIITALVLLMMPYMYIEGPKSSYMVKQSMPIELINFGPGDGTGLSSGNLSEEGRLHKGQKPLSELHDASIAAKTQKSSSSSEEDINLSNKLNPVTALKGDTKNDGNKSGTGTRDIGSPDGDPDYAGLGSKGFGPGKGLGLGDIDWGGGGNRVVLRKVMPKYPPNTQNNARIQIRFTVSQEGNVIEMYPLMKGDPALEKSAMEALRNWKFNPLKVDKVMEGIITFTFRLS